MVLYFMWDSSTTTMDFMKKLTVIFICYKNNFNFFIIKKRIHRLIDMVFYLCFSKVIIVYYKRSKIELLFSFTVNVMLSIL